MKLFKPALLVVFLQISSPGLAQNHGAGHDQNAVPGAMSHHHMPQMQKHMREMQQTMQRIKQTEDPQQRKELMQQHKRAMREGMEMMNGTMTSGMHDERMKNMSMEERLEMMQTHMHMMQMMMGQMIEHQVEEE